MKNTQENINAENIQDWLIEQFAKQLDLEPDDIDTEESFDNYGLDSGKTLILLGRLEKWLGKELSPVLIFNYPNINELAERLAEL